MAAAKNIAVSFRVSQEFKKLLEAAAARENRSQTNMLETLLLAHCKRHGIGPPGSIKTRRSRTS
jgi:uncharacterized protein (DUF1778 family)